jgi:hypothetical protein
MKDATSLAEMGKLEQSISMLKKTVPLKPEDSSAKDLLQVFENKLKAEKTNKHIEAAKKLQTAGKQKEAYNECLAALTISSDNNVKALLDSIFNSKNKEIVKIKDNHINALEKKFDKCIEQADFEEAQVIASQMAVLNSEKGSRLAKRLAEYKELYASRYISKAVEMSREKMWADAYKYYNEASKLLSSDAAITDQKNIAKKEYEKQRKFTVEENLYTEKIYYNAAIALAVDEKPVEAWKEVDGYNPVFKWNTVLEEYLIKNKLADRLMPN